MICFPKKIVFITLAIATIVSVLLIANKISQSKNVTDAEAVPPEIIGGKEANEGEWPFMAALYDLPRFEKTAKVKDAFFCSGFLISDQWVLTAAHCVQSYKDKPQQIKVLLNFNSFGEKNILNKSSNVEKVIVHEDYINDYFLTVINDIALLKLSKKQSSPYIALNSNQSLIKKDVKGYDLGWGITSSFSDQPSEKLKEIVLSIATYKQINKLYYNIFFVYDESGSMAGGDSGGPFIIWNNNKYYAAGINSKEAFYRDWDVPNSPRLSGGDVTNIAKYIDWIKTQTKIDFNKTNSASFIGKPPEWITPTPKK